MNFFLNSFREYYRKSSLANGGSEAGSHLLEELLDSKPPLDVWSDRPVVKDVAAALEDSVSLIAADLFAFLRSQVNWGLRSVETPIEGMFFLSLVCLAARRHMTVEHREREYTDVARLFTPNSGGRVGVLRVNVQPTIGEYRVDFLLEYSRLSSVGEGKDTASTAQPVFASFAEAASKLVVECDGHDFHERTKEQAEADKSRDRTLQSVGYNVFRFTGSKLTRDPFACARECLAFLLSRATGEDISDMDYFI